jgi:signal transduction histidine kinase
MVPLLNQPWPYLATAALAALLALYAWTQPRRPGSRYVAASAGVWSLWALAAGAQTLLQAAALRFDAFALQSTCALLEAPLQLMVVLEYTGSEKWLARRRLRLLFLPALLFLLLALILPHNFLGSFENHAAIEVIVGSKAARWGSFAFVAAVQLVIAAVLLNCLQRAPAFRVPVLLIGLGPMITLVAFALLDPQRLTVSPIQATVLFACVTCVLYFVALYNYHFLRVIPVAQDLVIQHMPYALLVLDAENRLVDLNAGAQALPGLPGKLALRQAATDALGDWWERIAPLIGPTPVSQDVAVQSGPGQRIFHVVSLPLLQASGWRMGQAFVLEEVTQARQAQQQQAQAQWAQATREERQQLADELHDGLSQSLAFLNLQAQAAQVYLEAGQREASQASVVRLGQAARQVEGDMRELIGDLLTISLPSEGFCDTLRRVAAQFGKQNGLHVSLEIEHDAEISCAPSVLPPAAGVQLLRIVQEALANVRKHAGSPTLIDLRLRAQTGQLQLTITDNGTGFDPLLAGTVGKHYGLQVMRQRAASIGGQLAIHSAPDQGTRVEVSVPLAGRGGEREMG